MRPPWLQTQGGRVRRLALLPLVPISWLYGAAAALHRRLSGVRGPVRLPCRVVSIGNLVVGGSGKTPTAAWLATALHARGHKVTLASRGYGRRGRGVVVVSDGRFVRGRAETAGDEPMLLAAHAPGVPVLVGRDRTVVGWRALSAFGADIVVLDDGFQHHRLHRDVDLVVFDGAVGFGGGRCLPSGPLREPACALREADAIGIVDGPLAEDDVQRLERWAPGALRFAARREPAFVRALDGSGREPPAWLRGRELGMLCGIAQPRAFRRSLERLGARVVAERCFGDHHRYRPADLAGLATGASLWVTTEKDAIKIPSAWTQAADVRVLVIELEVEEPARLIDWLEARLR